MDENVDDKVKCEKAELFQATDLSKPTYYIMKLITGKN
jgi:hypothetical protein